MKVLVDMNLSQEWAPLFADHGWEAQHWRTVGPGNADDDDIMAWARTRGFVVLTQDLDFTQLLFACRAGSPSVVLLRVGDDLDATVRQRVCADMRQAQSPLETGAILVVDPHRTRLRRLPIED